MTFRMFQILSCYIFYILSSNGSHFRAARHDRVATHVEHYPPGRLEQRCAVPKSFRTWIDLAASTVDYRPS